MSSDGADEFGGTGFDFDFGKLFGGFSKNSGNDLFGVAQSIFGGMGNKKSAEIKASGLRTEAENYRLAAALAEQNAEFTRQSTGVKLAATDRAIYQATGKLSSEIAGSNLGSGGSALDIMRSSVHQGAITKQLVGQQGLITEAGYDEQKQAYTNMARWADEAANATEDSGMFSQIMGLVGGGLKLGTMFL